MSLILFVILEVEKTFSKMNIEKGLSFVEAVVQEIEIPAELSAFKQEAEDAAKLQEDDSEICEEGEENNQSQAGMVIRQNK